jgi:hypothetical protein
MKVKGLRLVEIPQSSEAPAIADVSLAVREQVSGWHLSMFHVSQVMRREVSGGNSGGRLCAKAARPIL